MFYYEISFFQQFDMLLTGSFFPQTEMKWFSNFTINVTLGITN